MAQLPEYLQQAAKKLCTALQTQSESQKQSLKSSNLQHRCSKVLQSATKCHKVPWAMPFFPGASKGALRIACSAPATEPPDDSEVGRKKELPLSMSILLKTCVQCVLYSFSWSCWK